jgi:hypothetical protein
MGGSGNTVVAAAHLHRLLLQQVLDTWCWRVGRGVNEVGGAQASVGQTSAC